jgi:hypothetical protein
MPKAMEVQSLVLFEAPLLDAIPSGPIFWEGAVVGTETAPLFSELWVRLRQLSRRSPWLAAIVSPGVSPL